MTVLIVLLMFVGFVASDLLVRAAARRLQIRRELRERAGALDRGLRLDVSHEAPSLKRVEVPNAKARVLAVDDEPGLEAPDMPLTQAETLGSLDYGETALENQPERMVPMQIPLTHEEQRRMGRHRPSLP